MPVNVGAFGSRSAASKVKAITSASDALMLSFWVNQSTIADIVRITNAATATVAAVAAVSCGQDPKQN
jgi:hypothetical protein